VLSFEDVGILLMFCFFISIAKIMLQGYFVFILNKYKFNTYKSEISIVKWKKRKEKSILFTLIFSA
jgi:hypothetical protein